ncbi:MAG: class I SAM-dependent methyltransferase [Paenibacillaceae bacterium]|nr:class I SAM-dependent methyltransferase [Paenibacillaceae bacterium]
MDHKEKGYEQTGVAMTCRSFEEYVAMFALDEAELKGPLLDVAGGASSFVATARQRGVAAFAADPLYAMAAADIEAYGAEEIAVSTAKLAAIRERFDWSYYGSLERHEANRRQSLQLFCDDYRSPDARAAYVPASLPHLPYADGTFAMVTCSHFLFLYADQFDDAFHRAALVELMRVCKPGGEVRVYPLRSLRWMPYAGMDELLAFVRGSGADVRLLASRLPFIPGSSELLAIRPFGEK